jgi:tRNA G10  N-methylase Trm11
MGIGSEVYQALVMGRKAIGFELKESYYDQAKRNIQLAVNQQNQLALL